MSASATGEAGRAVAAGGPPGGGDAAEVFLTLSVSAQLCGVPVRLVRDVLGPQAITRIPLAPREVAGSLNLRGRIVTALDLRRRLGLPERGADAAQPMSVVVEHGADLYSLLADGVGDVVPLGADGFAPNPPTLDAAWREISRGVHRDVPGEDGRLLIVLDVERVLALG